MTVREWVARPYRRIRHSLAYFRDETSLAEFVPRGHYYSPLPASEDAAVEPAPESFRAAAAWQVTVPRDQLKGLDDALLNIDFVGDFARLYTGVHMLDDWFYNGERWQFGLRQAEAALDQPLTVSVMPLRADAPVYIPKEGRPDFGGKPQIAALRGVTATPVYLLKVKP